MSPRTLPYVSTWIVLSLISVRTFAADPTATQVDYVREIKPILKARCYACHGALKQESDLRLDTGASIRKGGQSGAIVTAEKSGGALLDRITTADKSIQMPPEGERLSAEQISLVTRWIEQGATSPDDEQPEQDPKRHWAFLPPIRVEVPFSPDDSWGQNPIDAFVAREHARHKLQRQPTAAKAVLLRRVYLDLIGLPPASDQLNEFLADDSSDAYAKVVEQLLGSPQYGERWGRHWMDIWRYADWFGRRYVPDVWNSAPQIWRWRDWIVNSLNDDKSYAQMVSEMLAADEISPENDEASYATGYLIRNWYALNPNDWMRSNVEHTGKAFLGLTLNCAHCHDHKYDPITQDDYFHFRAFFEPIAIRQDRVAGEADPGAYDEYKYGILRKIQRLGSVRIFDKTPDAPTWFYTGGDERNRLTDRGSIKPAVPAFLMPTSFHVSQVKLPPRAFYPGLRPSIHATILDELQASLVKVDAELPVMRDAANSALPDLRTKLNEAEAELARSRQASIDSGRRLAIADEQSLLLDATKGRRLVSNGLRGLKALDDGSTVRFQLRILKDAHVNFQLINDVAKGMTGSLIAFTQGKILAYNPGTSEEFEVGGYDFAAGQNQFEVELILRAKPDNCLLTVRSLTDRATLVGQIPVARNGWNPVGDANKSIAFDARTGSVAAIDSLELTSQAVDATEPDKGLERFVHFDFEAPRYQVGRDIVGIDGWYGSTHSQAGAISIVSSTIGDEASDEILLKLRAAQIAVDAHDLKWKSLEVKRDALLAEINSVKARIAADRAKYGEVSPSGDQHALTQLAAQSSHSASALKAEADLVVAKSSLAIAEAKPADDANRGKEIDAAVKQLVSASEAWDKTKAAEADPKSAESYPAFSPVYPDTSTGRRTALVEWIASRDNPLTARVAVNHIWSRHFHSPLVATVFDFGVNGAKPTHPELIDWLAVEFMESGWSMKHLHRLIVTSNTYQMSSGLGADDNPSRSIDVENRFLWHMNRGRMESEVVRDSLLAVAGQLDTRMAGQELENTQALTAPRRTVYFCCQPEVDGKSAFGALFDAPEATECYRRTKSIIPQQALALTNSDLIHEISGQLAALLFDSLPKEQQADPATFIAAAYRQILSRSPTEIEQRACLEYFAEATGEEAVAKKLREGLVRVLMNHNDFVSIR